MKLVVACIPLLILGVACKGNGGKASTTASLQSYDEAIQKAASSLAPYSTQTEQQASNVFVLTTYRLKGITTDEAVAKMEPILRDAGFRVSYKFELFTAMAPNHGGFVTLANPDPQRAPEAFMYTTARRQEFASK
jgi:hypothetical protein